MIWYSGVLYIVDTQRWKNIMCRIINPWAQSRWSCLALEYDKLVVFKFMQVNNCSKTIRTHIFARRGSQRGVYLFWNIEMMGVFRRQIGQPLEGRAFLPGV